MAAPYSFVVRDDNTRKTYDARVKNKFKWEWLTEKDTHGDFLSSDIKKNRCGRIGLVLFWSKQWITAIAARPALVLMLVNWKSINENVG